MNAISQTIQYQALNYQRFVKALLLLAMILISCYIYLVYSTIYSAVSRQNDLDTLAALESKVVGLEAKYLGLTSDITLERARALGFHNVDSQSLALSETDPKLASLAETP